MNWLYCTMIFGSLPIAIRFIVSLSVPNEQIPLFHVADFAFWGIMFNIAAITNVSTIKKASSDLIISVVAIAIVYIVFFVTLYCIVLFPSVNQGVAAWCAVLFVLATSVFISHCTTDRQF